jgi:hypothetical protein
MVIDYIFEGDIFGKRVKEREIAGTRLHFSKHSIGSGFIGRSLNTLSLLFPSPKQLGDRYLYARKYPILAPVAWAHRLLYCIVRKDLTPSQKKNYLFPDETTKSTMEGKAGLLSWLQLQ